ncbi:MAG: T9SS type A sorting domain-containing protein [Candidatus Cloacimonetes bacterium]|nr:T9SS type A sorting domain-containing protein [Candidatus Cloacimonadota bacterium]
MRNVLFTLFLLSFGMLAAGVVQQSYTIPVPSVELVDGWHRVALEGGVTLTQPGLPSLPVWPVRLLLPPGERAVSVEVSWADAVNLGDGYEVFPQQTPVPTSHQGAIDFTAPDATVYGSDSAWPAADFTTPDTQYMRGHSIALLQVCPVRYRPASGELLYHPEVTVTITTAPHIEAQSALQRHRGDQRTIDRVETSVDNPSSLALYPATTRDRIEGHMLVIITGAGQVSYFDDFVEFKTRQGFNPLVMTVEDIDSNYTGVDTQDRIRAFIIDCYDEHDTDYVILGGDVQIVPFRGFYLQAGSTVDNNLPADMYFSCLDRVGMGDGPDWNTNGNNHWGEPGEADYFPELAIGRISANTSAQFDAALNKQIMYQLNPVVGDLDEALMVGEELNDNPLTWGGDYKDQIIDGGSYNGYTTTGISNDFDTDTMYERNGNWSRSQLTNRMNAGLNLLNHLGHSSTDYNMKFSNQHVTDNNLTSNGVNHNFFIIYSQGCYPAAFDYNDSIAEKFTTIDNGCGVFVGNSRYGWYQPGGTNSSSQYMDRQFYDALFGEGITRVGDANDDSKVDGAGQCNGDAWFRWTYYELNVLGDPSLDVWTSTPQTLTTDYSQQIPLTTTILPVAAGAPNALICVSKDGEQLVSAWANANGNTVLNFPEPFTDLGILDIYITAHDYLIHTGAIQIIAADQPFIIVDDWSILSGDDDQLEFGESGTITLSLRNIGNQPSDDIDIDLSTLSSYLDFTDNTEQITALAAGELIELEAAFSFELEADVPDQQPIPITIDMSDGSYSWSPQIVPIALAPLLALGNIVVDDDNGHLDPSETVDVEVWLGNDGSADLHDLVVNLSTADPYITLNQSTASISLLEAGNQVSMAFNITVSSDVEEGYMASFVFEVDAEQGIDYYDTFVLMVGVLGENFETGDFSNYDWETSGSADWYVTSGAYEGSYCARSGNIGNNQTTTLSLDLNTLQNGTIGFWYKVSCENGPANNYDYLCFTIDGQEQGRWDGIIGWSYASFPVTGGQHTFSWAYSKDPAVSSGSDCVWIDMVEFPPFVGDVLSVFFLSPSELDFGVVDVGQSATRSFTIFNMGSATLTGNINVPEGFSLDSAASTRKPSETGRGEPASRTEVPYNIEPSQMAQFQLTFTPPEEGDFSAGIIITSNDPFHAANVLNVIASTFVATDDEAVQFVDALLSNHPNPFNPTTTIALSVASNHTPVRVDIYNLRGQRVLTLHDGLLDQGEHSLVWHGQDDQDRAVGSGIYFLRTQIGDKAFLRKMLMLK